MLRHSTLQSCSSHLPTPTKLELLACLISGDVVQRYKASILTSPIQTLPASPFDYSQTIAFKAPILVYTHSERVHSYKRTERLDSNETSQRKTLFLNRMWQFRFHFNELYKRYKSAKTSLKTLFCLLIQPLSTKYKSSVLKGLAQRR